jgi:hypothetical protein
MVRVARNYNPESSRERVDIKLRKVMQHIDAHLADPQDLRFRDRLRPGPAVVVAAHGGQWREALKLFENPGVADIAGVHDEIAPVKER